MTEIQPSDLRVRIITSARRKKTVSARIVGESDLPSEVTQVVGTDRHSQLHAFITAMIDASAGAGAIGLDTTHAQALADFRAFNYDRIYLRPDAKVQAKNVIALLQQLTEWLAHHPQHIGDGLTPTSASEATAQAVRYVSGMTDRFALTMAVEHLGWDPQALPRGV